MKAPSVNSCRVRGLCASGALLLVLAVPGVVGAQGNPEPLEFKFDRGQDVQPIFAGWARKTGGGYSMYFGYINRNYVETPAAPVGPDNRFEPGQPDRGQPTLFNTRIHAEVFHVDVPADWGDQRELVWTLTVNGKTERAVAWLQPDWEIDPVYHGKMRDAESLKNTPPVLTVASAATASVAAPLVLTATATDDGLPTPRQGPRKVAAVAQETPPTLKPEPNQPEILLSVPEVGRGRGGGRGGPQGLAVSWIVWRGPDNAQFSQGTIPVKDQKATVEVTFPKPGTYVLRGTANDGELKVEKDVTVTVK
jgi:hypothetical protein